MQTLLVTHVEPYSPDSEVASITLKSSHGEMEVFCHLYGVKAGDRIPNQLTSLGGWAQAASLTDWPEDLQKERAKERLERFGPYAYRGVGRVIDQDSGLIEVLGFHIELGEVPCDGVVEFECERIDLFMPE